MKHEISISLGKKVYFASDFHLGLYPYEKSREREKRIVRWLDEIKKDAQDIFLLGDIFDFWFEYSKVVPRGFTRFLGKLSELSDNGIKIHFFTGNHDLWINNYLPLETGVIIYRKPAIFSINNKSFFLAHGDGLGPGDYGYKFLKAVFKSKTLKWFFSRIHPNFAVWIGQYWSRKSRYSKGISEEFKGEEKEIQILFAKSHLKKEETDFFIFGHRHIPLDKQIEKNCRLINLGEWIFSNTYAVFDGNNMELKSYK